jgi:hypothetical protein
MVDKGTTMTTATAKLLATYKDIMAPIATPTGIYIPVQRGYQNNTADIELVTSNTGYTEKVSDPAPQIVGFGKISYCDYKTFFAADGQDRDFYLILDDGVIEGTLDSSGSFTGYWGSLNTRYNAPNADNIAEGYPFYVNFLDINEWKVKSTQVIPNFSVKELAMAQPAGLFMEVVVPWSTNEVTVKITKRCSPGEPYVYMAAAPGDFVIISADSDLTPSISAVDDASKSIGVYVLTTLNVADDIDIQARDDDSTNLTYQSQVMEIDVA